MKNRAPLSLLAIAFAMMVTATSAHAALLIHETRQAAQFSVNPATVVAQWNAAKAVAPTPGYGDTTVSNWAGNLVQNQTQNPGGSNQNIFYHFQMNYSIDVAQEGTWNFRLAGDFGGGGAAFVDGVLLASRLNDHWWGNNLNNTGSMIVGSSFLTAGNHTIDVYGSEGCCDGHSGMFYKIGGDPNDSNGFIAFTSTGLADQITVPEPATAVLGLMAFGGMMLRRRRAA